MREIPLTQGLVATVDDGDFDWLAQWKWHVTGRNLYAARSAFDPSTGRQSRLWMHREIIKPPAGLFVDHINGDVRDNRRSNLRVCTIAQNAMNKRPNTNGRTSRYKGVHRIAGGSRWRADIEYDGVQHCLGHFESELVAAAAYDALARILFGAFARQNLEGTEAEEQHVLLMTTVASYKRPPRMLRRLLPTNPA